MRQRRAFRRAGRARRELDVDRIVGTQLALQFSQTLALVGAAHAADVVETEHSRRRLAAHANHDVEFGQFIRLQLTGCAAVELGRQLAQHVEVPARLESLVTDDGPAARLDQCMLELVEAISRVDVDEYGADLGRRHLGQHPFARVRSPGADALTGADPEGQQTGGQVVDPAVELGVGPAHPLVADDQRLRLSVSLDDALEIVADRLVDDRLFRCATRIALRQSRHGRSSARRRSRRCIKATPVPRINPYRGLRTYSPRVSRPRPRRGPIQRVPASPCPRRLSGRGVCRTVFSRIAAPARAARCRRR